jgi:RimJ/RimL family protein N-acetyltransferase
MLIFKSEILVGKYIQLEPMRMEHSQELAYAGREPSIWKYMLYGMVTNEEKMIVWVLDILNRKASGTDEPFVVRDLSSGRIVGATRYLNISHKDRGLEVGGTWYDTDFQRTYVNSEAKYLMLQNAFETVGCVRVQFKADSRNEKSLKAIERLGAKKEGVLRNHMILDDGTLRHSVFFSILPEEWPEVKEGLARRLYQ